MRVYQCQIVKKPVNALVQLGNRLRCLTSRFRSLKEHGMGSQNTEFHRGAFLIDARGALTAMDDLTGWEADRIQIL